MSRDFWRHAQGVGSFTRMVSGTHLRAQPMRLNPTRKAKLSRFRRLSFLAMLALGFSHATTSNTFAQRSQDVIYWAKTEFTIPFHVDGGGRLPSEVQLEVSTDNGRTWSLYASDQLTSRQFRFASFGDGLYLFRIKTIDDRGFTTDSGNEPLRVLVDTQSPELRLIIDTNQAGQMVADFTIIEANPRLDSIRLEYQTESDYGWRTIPVDVRQTGNEELTGQGVWDLPFSTKQLAVRLVAKDAAGNESEVTRLPMLPKTAAGGPSSLTLTSGRPNSSNPQTTSNSQSSAGRYQFKPIQDLESNRPTRLASNEPLFLPLEPDSSRPPFSSNQPPVLSLDRPIDAIPSQSLSPQPPYAPSASSTSSAGLPSLPLPTNPDLNRPPQGTTQSVDAEPYYSHSRSFSLDYDVDSNNGTPVANIELWGTIDSGKTWEMWGTDPDRTSPFDIQVESDGLFGFRMVIVGINGLASNRPRNGDNADAWVLVDTQPPSVRIASALYGKGAETGSLVIQYNARDSYFSQTPITLSYSELPTGPWTTIATGLPNTGRYLWPANPNLPRQIYLQIEAYDLAGNVGKHVLDLPVDVEGLAPRGRIQGFRAISTP